MSDDPLTRLRAICLALPETTEQADGRPVFQVRAKTFAMFMEDHHGDGRVALWCKAPAGMQDALVSARPDRFFIPPYVGHNGWIGIHLNRFPDWDEVAALVEQSYRMTAPKRLLSALDSPPGRAVNARAD